MLFYLNYSNILWSHPRESGLDQNKVKASDPSILEKKT